MTGRQRAKQAGCGCRGATLFPGTARAATPRARGGASFAKVALCWQHVVFEVLRRWHVWGN